MMLCRRRLSRLLLKAFKGFLWLLLILLVAAFIAPARNFIGYFFLPGAWRDLSTFRIIHLYFADPHYPVSTTVITCDGIQDTMKKVQWQKIVSEMNSFKVYDENYFKELQRPQNLYGTTQQDIRVFNERYHKFKPSMTALWQHQMLVTFKMFKHAMEVFNVTYFLSEGSMLGAYRHHGFIPWDDDMDICMNGTDWLKVKQILHCLPEFDVDADDNMMFKFFWNKSPLWLGEDFIRFPFIDIFFFNEDDQYLWAMTHFKKNRIVFKKSDIFPLTHLPYEGMIVPVPGQVHKICTTVYDPTVCVSRDFDHLNRHFLPFYQVEYIPCYVFSRIYPFVSRKEMTVKGRQATVEYRMLGKYIISNFTIYH